MSNSYLSDIAKKLDFIEANNTMELLPKRLITIGKQYGMWFSKGPMNVTFIDIETSPKAFTNNIMKLLKSAGSNANNQVIDPRRISIEIEKRNLDDDFFVTGKPILYSGNIKDLKKVIIEYVEEYWNY
jgi:hypothetical protein